MVGDVYSISIKGAHHDDPHPHAIVIEISGAKECICVPAFSTDGLEVNLYLDNIEALGVPRNMACVRLDNSKMIQFTAPGYTGKPAYWLVERFRRLSKSVLRESELIGEMKPEGVAAIAGAMIKLNELRPETFTQPILKRLRRIATIESGPANDIGAPE